MPEIEITEWFSTNENCDIVENEDSDNDSDEINKNTEKQLVIYIFGKTQNNESVSIRVMDFPCYFYMLLPDKWTNNNKPNKYKINNFVERLKSKLSYNDKKSYIGYDIQRKKKFYGFTNNEKYTFIRIKFTNTIAMRNCSEIFIKKNK